MRFWHGVISEFNNLYRSSRATRYGLDGPGIESRLGARFSAPVQTGPGAHPASYIVSNGSFPRLKRPGRGVDHPSPSSSEVKDRVELYVLLSLWDFSWPVICWNLPLPIFKKYVTFYDDTNDIPVARTFCPPLHALCDMERICFCNFPELLSASMSSGKRLHCVGWHHALHVG